MENETPDIQQKEQTAPTKMQRDFATSIVETRADSDPDVVEIAFSSEEPYPRSFGYEILGHRSDEVDLAWLASGSAPFLIDHTATVDNQVGVVESARIDQDGRGRAKVRFGQSEKARQILADIRSGILRNISVGYQITSMSKLEGKRDGLDVYRVAWTPLEISLVAIPADKTVGVGRSDAPVIHTPIIEVKSNMENEHKNEAADVKRNDIAAIAEHFGVTAEEFRKFVAAREQGTANEIRAHANVGLSTRETQDYSLSRALEGLVDPTKRGLEWEASAAAAAGRDNYRGGLIIPTDVLTRTMTTAAGTGGDFVPTEHGALIDMLYANTVVKQMGATVFPAVAGTSFPVITSGANVGFVGELSTTAPSTPTTAARKTRLRTVDGVIPLSRALFKQSRPSLDGWIQQHLARVLAIKIDRTVFDGTGVGEVPAGLLNKAGIPVRAIGANGGAISWADVVGLESMVSHANAAFGSLGYVTNAKVIGAMKTTPKVSGDSNMIFDGTLLNGHKVASTSLVPANLSKGTGTNLSAMVFGNFADIYLAEFGTLEIVADPYTAMGTQEYLFRAFIDCDFIFAHDESFAVIKDIVA